ncbi:hypothetical protein F2Q69_00038319 [Brassica cretica]|uniref:Uncharacterized protein n=1 Tax=Brassica cretica TaxID=69181 RepID=A0A8S9SVY9_BRACR|nr:hypothetical protein F2Q69_00038319 [Brassica cretica]
MLFPEPSIHEWLSRAWCEDYSVPSILAKAKIPANSFPYVSDVSLAMSDKSVSETKATNQHEPSFESLEPSMANGVHVTGLLRAAALK